MAMDPRHRPPSPHSWGSVPHPGPPSVAASNQSCPTNLNPRQDSPRAAAPALALSLDEVTDLLDHLASKKHTLATEYRALVTHHRVALDAVSATAQTFRSSRSQLKHDLDSLGTRFFTAKDARAPAVAASVRDHNHRVARLAQIDQCRQLLTKAHDVHNLLETSVAHARDKHYDKSAQALASAYTLAQTAATSHPDLLVYRDAVKVVERHMRGLSSRLRSVIDGMVTRTTSETGSIAVSIQQKFDSATGSLSVLDLLSALQLLQSGDAANRTFLTTIRDRLTMDVLSHPFVVTHDAASVTLTLDAPIVAQSPDAILAAVRAYAYALASAVPQDMACTTLDALFDQAIAGFLPKRVPDATADLDDFTSTVDQLQSLVADLMTRGLVSNATCTTIAAYSPHRAFTLRRQESVLERTRAMLVRVHPASEPLESISNPSLVDPDTIARVADAIQQAATKTADDPGTPITLTSKSLLLTRPDPLALPTPFPIPVYVHEFTLALVNEWQLATDPPTSSSSTEHGTPPCDLSLVASMVDMFLLHTRSSYLRTTPAPSARTVALAHNACLWITDVLTRLCVTHGGWHPLVARQVPRLLQMAKQLVNAQVTLARSDVVRVLAPLDPLWVDVVKHRQRIQDVLLRVVARVKAEAESLKGVAPDPIRNYWLGATYDAALQTLLNELYAWTDISAAESEELCSLLQTLLIPAHHFSLDASAAGSPALSWVPHYAAYYAVVELLNLSLRDILAHFRARRYATCLSVDQLTRLVVALFQDSEVRAAALAEMAGGVRLGLVLPGASATAAAVAGTGKVG